MQSDALQILLVEDDKNLGYLLKENLMTKGFGVTWIEAGDKVKTATNDSKYDLCIFDIMLPGIDGFTLAADYKLKFPNSPFIFLTARSVEQDKIRGFELGADDYITKPFSFKELYYRIRAILRRLGQSSHGLPFEPLSIGSVEFYPDRRILYINDNEKKLSQREAGLLHMLLQHKGNYVTRSELLKAVWGNDDYFTGKSMDVYITRVRKLLKEDEGIVIENLYGIGYRIKYETKNINSEA